MIPTRYRVFRSFVVTNVYPDLLWKTEKVQLGTNNRDTNNTAYTHTHMHRVKLLGLFPRREGLLRAVSHNTLLDSPTVKVVRELTNHNGSLSVE